MSTKLLRVARGSGDGAFAEYEIETGPSTTVLDALEGIRGTRASGLRYRHSCHHGSCGTCGALVNGQERLMCLSRIAELGPGPVTVEPLRKMTRIGDVAVSPEELFARMPENAGYLRSSDVAHRAAKPADPSAGLPGGGAWVRLENCIECAICVSVCPVTAAFSGPAALAAADRDREERPEREKASLAFASRPDGVAACERRFDCSRACPMGVYPGRRIENLRRSLPAQPPGAAFP